MNLEDSRLNKIADVEHVKADVNTNYLDDDIVMIDNVRLLTVPDAAQVQMNMIAFCNKGRVEVELNGEKVQVCESDMLICPPNTVFSGVMVSPDFDFKILFITNRMLLKFLHEKMNVWTKAVYVNKQYVYNLDIESHDFMKHFYGILRLMKETGRENPYKTEFVQSIIQGVLLGLCGMLRTVLEEDRKNPVPELETKSHHHASRSLFQQFIMLLGSLPMKHQPVAYYANKLCVTPKYLSTVCKKQSGKTANDWITEHVVEDIRYCLKSTDLPIKQICNQLGFPNASFFSKYVKEHFGKTPMELRELH